MQITSIKTPNKYLHLWMFYSISQAIFELFRGETDLVEDLRMILKTYRESLRSLGMLSECDIRTIFGPLEDLQPLHKGKILMQIIYEKWKFLVTIQMLPKWSLPLNFVSDELYSNS